MYDTILLPTDGSREMASAIEHAVFLAGQNDATLHVLYVVDLRSFIVLPEETQQRVVQLLHEEGEAAVSTVGAIAEEAAIDVVTGLTTGVPHEEILAYADEHEVDLIVIGTHGRTGEERRVLGSVAEEVVRSSPNPVVTVRASDDGGALEDVVADETPEAQRRYIS